MRTMTSKVPTCFCRQFLIHSKWITNFVLHGAFYSTILDRLLCLLLDGSNSVPSPLLFLASVMYPIRSSSTLVAALQIWLCFQTRQSAYPVQILVSTMSEIALRLLHSWVLRMLLHNPSILPLAGNPFWTLTNVGDLQDYSVRFALFFRTMSSNAKASLLASMVLPNIVNILCWGVQCWIMNTKKSEGAHFSIVFLPAILPKMYSAQRHHALPPHCSLLFVDAWQLQLLLLNPSCTSDGVLLCSTHSLHHIPLVIWSAALHINWMPIRHADLPASTITSSQ